MTTAKLDGCPRCSTRGSTPHTWNDETGRGDYRCGACRHSWTTHWQIPEPERGPRIADLPYEYESVCCMCGTPTDEQVCSPSCRRELNAAYGIDEELA